MIKNIRYKINNLNIEKRAFINGVYVNSIDKKTIDKNSSIDGRDISGLSACNGKDIDVAVEGALESYSSRVWVDLVPIEKQKIILKLADLIERNIEELALLDTLETGRSLRNYYYDSIPKAVKTIRWFANAIDKIYDQAVPPRKN